MVYVLVHHKVEDFKKWKPFYDGHENVRKKSGSKGAQLFRSKDNPNETVAIIEFESLEDAKKFALSPDLKETMKKAGVITVPDVYFLEEVQKSKA